MPVGPPVCVATNAPPSSHSDLPESCDGVHEGGDVMSSKYSLTVTRKRHEPPHGCLRAGAVKDHKLGGLK